MTNRCKGLRRLTIISIILSLDFVGVSAANAAGAMRMNSLTNSSGIPKRCTSRVKASGTVKYSDWQFPDTLNPYQTSLAVSAETTQSMFLGLWRYSDKARLVPVMATRIPSVRNGDIRDGGRTVIVHLRHGMLWSTGAEIVSNDVNFGFRVDSNRLTGPTCRGSCDVIARIDTPDKYTAVFHLKRTYAPFLTYGLPSIWPTQVPGAWHNNPQVAARALAQDPAYNFQHADPKYPTNGPYEVAQFVKDDRIVLNPMPEYNVTSCGAAIKTLIFAFYSSKPSMMAAAAARQTDVTQNYTMNDLPQLRKHTTAFRVHVDTGFIIEHMEFNHDRNYNGRPNPTANVKVRQALALALDKAGLIRSALSVNSRTARSVMAWTFLASTPQLHQPFADTTLIGQWDPVRKTYVKDTGMGRALADARKLLSQTPFKHGFSLDFYTPSGSAVRAAQESVAAANWARLGVTVKPNFPPTSKLFGDWQHAGIAHHGKFQVLMFAWINAPDPDGFKYDLQNQYIDRRSRTHTSINNNDAGIKSATIDSAFNAAAHSLSTAVRQRYYSIVQREVNRQAHWIPLYFRPMIATEDGKVANWSNNPTSAGPEWNTFDWRPKQG